MTKTPPADNLQVRKARPGDSPTILRLIRALADYERLPPPDDNAQARLLHDIFADQPRIEVFLGEVDGQPGGYAFIFESYSSFLALPTLYLEDIFVLPEFRQRKLGWALFRAIVNEAYARGCGRMEWTVLDWNQLAIDFYERVGARHMHEWRLYRLTREEMTPLLT